MRNAQSNKSAVAWMHEVMSFIILCYDSKCIINPEQNHKKIYSLQIDGEKISMGEASNLYDAFIWFHNNLAEYQEKLYEIWMYSHYIGFGQLILPAPVFLYDMIQSCKRKAKNEFGLSCFNFYRMFLSVYKGFRPGLYILDLQTDLESQRNMMYVE